LIYFDCVVIETIGVLCRRAEEQKRSAMLPALLTSLEYLVPPSRISWTGGHLPRRYDSVLDLVRNTHGLLNFNDALIAILCQELSIGSIMSFDRDFDQIAWLRRVSSPQAL
jgi:predicted nucleic acid-binding protein